MIPKIIHQAFIGKPIPEREAGWCAQMKSLNSDFDVRLYENDVLERYKDDPYVKELMSRGEPLAFVVDRIRVLLLRDEGGIWLDPDCQPVRPLNKLDHVWNNPTTTFVSSFRDPLRSNVHLHRGITLADNTFLASAKNSRIVNRILEAWTPQSVIIDGHSTGVKILQYTDHDVCWLHYKYFYSLVNEPEVICLHDAHNLRSWVEHNEQRKKNLERKVA